MTRAIITDIPRQTLAEAAPIVDRIALCIRESDHSLVASYGPAPAKIASQASQAADGNSPHPIFGQETLEPATVKNDTVDHSSILYALAAEVAAMRDDFQCSRQSRTPNAHRAPQPPKRSYRPPAVPQAYMEEVCWYYQQFGDTARRCTP